MRSASALRSLNMEIPVASSNMARLSSGFAFIIISIRPCPIIE